MFLRLLLALATTLLCVSCTLDARLDRGSIDEVIPPVVLPAGAIDAGFINQNLPTALTKQKTHFGTVSPNRYYFLQPGPESDNVRKFVKISGGVKTERSLGATVTAHTYAFSTTSRIYYFSYEPVSSTQTYVFLRAIEKSDLSDAPFTCAGAVIDVDPKTFEVWQEGAEDFYFRANSSNPALSAYNGQIIHANNITCDTTNAVASRVYKASGKIFVINNDNNIYRLTAGTPTLIRSGTNRPVDSGMVEYNGDLYFRADIDATAGTNYRLNRIHASTNDAVEELPALTAANFPPKTVPVTTFDNGLSNYYCTQAQCLNDGIIRYLDMGTGSVMDIYNGPAISRGRVLPFDLYTTFVETEEGGSSFKYVAAPNTLNGLLDTNVTIEYGTNGLLGTSIYFPQYAFIGGTYHMSGFDPVLGESVIYKYDSGLPGMVRSLTTFKNPYSMRLRGGELFFLAEKDRKVQLFRGDGTDVGSTAVTQITSDDYNLGADFLSGTRFVRRVMDVTKEGADLYVFTAGKEKVYLSEYASGTVKYVEIPGAQYNVQSSAILAVRNSQVVMATPAHGHSGVDDQTNRYHHRHQSSGVQIVSYDGAQFDYWLDGGWGLPNYNPFYFVLGGEESLTAADDGHIVATLFSSIVGGGNVHMRRVFSLDKTAMTDVFGEHSQARVSTNGTKVAITANSVTPANNGLHIQSGGVVQKITTTAEEPMNHRWDGNTLYFVSEDSADNLQYIWSVDTSIVTPVPAKISAATVFGTIREDQWVKRVFKSGTDTYLLMPTAAASGSTWVGQQLNLWRVTGGVATRFSDDLIEEAVPVTGGFYYIAKATSGPDSGKRCIRRILTSGTASSACEDMFMYLKPSPLGLTVSTLKEIKTLWDDMTLTTVSKVYSDMSDSDYDTLMTTVGAGKETQELADYFNYGATSAKIFNWSFKDFVPETILTYRDLDGSNLEGKDYAPGLTLDASGFHVSPLTERSRGQVFYPVYSPQVNSLLFLATQAHRNYCFIAGANGPLDATPPP